MAWVKSAEFARIAGVSRAAITKRCKAGSLVRTPAGKLDTGNQVNKAFLAEQRKKGNKPKINPVSAKETAAAKQSLIQANPDTHVIEDGQEGKILLDAILSGETVIDALEHISKESVDRIKTIEQIRKLRIETDESLNKLIPRDLVKKVFSQLYAIDINEFKTLGPAISQDIITIMGVGDEKQIMKIEGMIDKHLRKVLQHIKRVFDDFLKSIEVEDR